MTTGIQRAVGWWKVAERDHGTRLGASDWTSGLKSRIRRDSPLYEKGIRIFMELHGFRTRWVYEFIHEKEWYRGEINLSSLGEIYRDERFFYFKMEGKEMKNAAKYKRQYYMPPVKCLKWTEKEYVDKAPIWCSVDLRDGNQADRKSTRLNSSHLA